MSYINFISDAMRYAMKFGRNNAHGHNKKPYVYGKSPYHRANKEVRISGP